MTTPTSRHQKPAIVRHTKASRLARESILETQKRPRRSLVDPLRSSTTQQQPRKRRSLITTKKSLEERSGWDMRGKISDLEAQLEQNTQQLEHLYSFKNDLTILNEGKDSERKQTLQRVMAVKAEFQALDKKHAQEVENLEARQRIRYQELKDQHFIYKRQEGTMEIVLEDTDRKLKQAETTRDQVMQERQRYLAKTAEVTTKSQQLEQEINSLEKKSKRFQGTLAERERDIHQLGKQLDKETPKLEAAELKLQKALAMNSRLEARIKEMET